ncbi:MAG: hypothetical protein EAX86_07990 [Candidatus Heimdallarchaeota archaeon]|nr:hypothetical protein [Candidatus Heimdallarchaeota archaeon]
MVSIRNQMLIEEQSFSQIINKKLKISIENINISHRTHLKIYRIFRNLLQYSPVELKQWIDSNLQN